MRRLLPLIVLVIIVFYTPFVMANPDFESLWCNSYVNNRLGWSVMGGPPYLDNLDGSYIYTKISYQTEGDFGFADLSSAGSITSVTLYLECKADDAPADDSFDVYVFDGDSWTNEGNIAPSVTVWGTYETLTLTTKLGTATKVNNAQIYFQFIKAKAADEAYIRRAYLYVDYTPSSGTIYNRYVSQSLSWSGLANRLCTFSRDPAQPLSLVSESYRTWSTSRTISTAITMTPTAFRECSLTRHLTQTLSFDFNAFTQIFRLIQRTANMGLTFTPNMARRWTLLRSISQDISASFDGNRVLTAVRGASQDVSFTSNAFAEVLRIIYRAVGIQLSVTTDSTRSLNITRVLTQTLSFTPNAWGETINTIIRKLSLSLSFTANNYLEYGTFNWGILNIAVKTLAGQPVENAVISAWQLNGTGNIGEVTNATGFIPAQNMTKGNYTILVTKEGYLTNHTLLRLLQNQILEIRIMSVEEAETIVNEFNAASLAILALGVIFTVIYFMHDKQWQTGAIAFGAWTISAMTTLARDTDAWPQATFFAGLAMIIVALMMMDSAGARSRDFWE